MAETREVRLGKLGEKRCLSDAEPWEGEEKSFPQCLLNCLISFFP